MTQDRLVFIYNSLVQYYRESLVERRDGQTYLLLHELGLSDRTIRDFALGYAPDDIRSFISFAEKTGISVGELLETRKLENEEDQLMLIFSGRIMIPVFDANDDPVGFIGRRIDKNNGPVYFCQVPADMRLIGLHIAKETKKDYLILCEGIMDPMLFYEKGYDNVVGYSFDFNERRAETIKMITKRAIIVPGHDDFGKKLGQRVCELLRSAGVQSEFRDIASFS